MTIGENNLMSMANTTILRIDAWMRRVGLELAPEKTETVLLTSRRKIASVEFDVLGHITSPAAKANVSG